VERDCGGGEGGTVFPFVVLQFPHCDVPLPLPGSVTARCKATKDNVWEQRRSEDKDREERKRETRELHCSPFHSPGPTASSNRSNRAEERNDVPLGMTAL
jgi:hypothetical protein